MPRNLRAFKFAAGLVLIMFLSDRPAGAAARWPQFRGESGTGVADPQKPPVEFGPQKRLLWKTPVPRGHSSPCIWDDRIFLTALNKGRLETLCIDRGDGRILWRREAPAQKLERINGMNSQATPTPVTDGQRVYALFGSFGLLAYDFQGNEQWRRPLAIGNVRHGSGASPILAGGRLIVNCDQEDMKSFVIAVSPADGDILWQTQRPLCFSSHTTPLYLKRDSVEEVLVSGSIRLVAYDLKDGAERWTCHGLEAISICPSPIFSDGVVYAMSFSMPEKLPNWQQLVAKYDSNHDGKIVERESPRLVKDVFSIIDSNHDGSLSKEEWDVAFGIFDQADNGMMAIRPGEHGEVSGTNLLWRQKRAITEVASPLCYRGAVFIIRGGGFASSFDAKTGRPLYENKRIGADGQYFASPIAADGKIYVASTLGVVSVIEAGDEPKVLARNSLDEAIAATPAIADDRIYIRSAEHLWAFGR